MWVSSVVCVWVWLDLGLWGWDMDLWSSVSYAFSRGDGFSLFLPRSALIGLFSYFEVCDACVVS